MKDVANNYFGLSVRGDSLYCPLAFSLDSYWGCANDCWHCYLRNMNYIWGNDIRVLDTEYLNRKLSNGLKNKDPKTSLAWCLKHKKTLRWGNKSDPFQSIEKKFRVAPQVFDCLIYLDWSFVIQTKCTDLMMEYEDYLIKSSSIVVVQTYVTVGMEQDWEIFERCRTTPIENRLKHLKKLKSMGISVGVLGEPFIPGYHTIEQFENTVKLLSSEGLKNYNVYNFHFNAFVAKRLNDLGIDIEHIWFMNQDVQWKAILVKLIDLSKKYGMILGCPDFVNSGHYQESVNTCCGIDVPNPCKFNVINWKKQIYEGMNKEEVFCSSWEGIGNYEEGKNLFYGHSEKYYDMEEVMKEREGLLF